MFFRLMAIYRSLTFANCTVVMATKSNPSEYQPGLRLWPVILFVSHPFAKKHERNRVHRHLGTRWLRGRDYEAIEISSDHRLHGLSNKELRRVIRERIRESDVVIVCAIWSAQNREWIQYEVDTARKLKKPILLVLPYTGARYPRALIELSGRNPIELACLQSRLIEELPADKRRDLQNSYCSAIIKSRPVVATPPSTPARSGSV